MSNLIQKTFEVSNISSISIGAPGKLFLVQSGDETLSIEAPQAFFDEVEIKNEDGQLAIHLRTSHILQWLFRQAFSFQSDQVTYRIGVNQLNHLSLGGDIIAEVGTIKSENLKISNSGSIKARFEALQVANELMIKNSGSVKAQLDTIAANIVELSVSGSADLDVANVKADTINTRASGSMKFSALAGEINQQSVHISGSGNYDAWKIRSNSTELHISGSGKAKIWAENALKIHVSGSGTIHYHGNANVEQHVSGAGSIKKLDADAQ